MTVLVLVVIGESLSRSLRDLLSLRGYQAVDTPLLEETELFLRKSGGELAGIEFGDPIKPYAAVWLHATGFNAMTYQSLLAPLGLRARIAALDMRGHGRSTLPAKPRSLKSWSRFRDDVIEWLEKEAPHGVVLGGHSMGGLFLSSLLDKYVFALNISRKKDLPALCPEYRF